MTCGKKNGRCKCSRCSTRGSAGSCEENEDRGRTRRKRTNIRARRARGFQAPRSSASGHFTPRRPRENQGKSTSTGNNALLAPGQTTDNGTSWSASKSIPALVRAVLHPTSRDRLAGDQGEAPAVASSCEATHPPRAHRESAVEAAAAEACVAAA